MEDRFGERVEVTADLGAFGPERVGMIEDRGDAHLLGHGWQVHLQPVHVVTIQPRHSCGLVHGLKLQGLQHPERPAAVEVIPLWLHEVGGINGPSRTVDPGDAPDAALSTHDKCSAHR